MTISLNCYLETFIQNKQNLLFLYFCKIVQAYIQQPNWLLVQNCPNIHQIFEGGQVYIDAATWCWEPRPWKRPALHFLGKKCQENFYIFDQTMDRSMIPDVCHSQELKWCDSCWWRFQLNTLKWWYQKDNLISQGATKKTNWSSCCFLTRCFLTTLGWYQNTDLQLIW